MEMIMTKTYDELKEEKNIRDLNEYNRQLAKVCQLCEHDKVWHYDGKCHHESYEKTWFSCFGRHKIICSCKEYVALEN